MNERVVNQLIKNAIKGIKQNPNSNEHHAYFSGLLDMAFAAGMITQKQYTCLEKWAGTIRANAIKKGQ